MLTGKEKNWKSHIELFLAVISGVGSTAGGLSHFIYMCIVWIFNSEVYVLRGVSEKKNNDQKKMIAQLEEQRQDISKGRLSFWEADHRSL